MGSFWYRQEDKTRPIVGLGTIAVNGQNVRSDNDISTQSVYPAPSIAWNNFLIPTNLIIIVFVFAVPNR